ncbi:conserved hypothetical protein [Culex quinquefasciatus]|uniref:Acyltransferase 3 domain-containing protein n=1 Tax=Culex quinquefasciatus TaxID=7176 RepID=B0WNX5_CULQU|nr:conserved hypothetical protein [Culex quinquefasciatus]|eukprot:XP_001850409.1 conserved hypothetical protein [Culex quinquefasciatus]
MALFLCLAMELPVSALQKLIIGKQDLDVVKQPSPGTTENGPYREVSEYYRMPKTYEYDDYDQCLSDVPVGQVAAYCLVRVVIKPDDESDRWHWIKEFSSDQKRHMNHALLDRGICIEHCKKLARELSNETRQALKVEKFDFDFPYIFDVSVFKDTPKDRERYADLVETCINYKLNKTYQLTAYTEIEVCDKNEEPFEVALLILLMVASTLYDKRINYKRSDDHYREELTSKKKAFFASFSILRNWYRLTSRSQGNVHKMFRPLQAVRFITTVMVIMGHAVLIAGITPNSNTFWIETVLVEFETLYHNIAVMILTGGTQVVQIFLTMSGFLVAYHVLVHPGFAKKGLGLLFLVKAIVLRYIRLTPMYAFVVLLHATWLIKLQDGPMWKRGVETERTFCRRNWWTNLLYVNNFVNADQPWFRILWPFVLPLAIASFLLHYIFYVNDFETPSVWMSIFYPAMKYSWGICLVWFAYGVLYGNAPVLKRFLNHRIFEPLGRLAYATFLSHTFIMRLLFLNTRSPQHSNLLGMTGMVFSSVVLSYSMATFLCLSMELPVSALQKLLFGKQDVEAAPKKPEAPQVASNNGEAQPNGDSKSENTA